MRKQKKKKRKQKQKLKTKQTKKKEKKVYEKKEKWNIGEHHEKPERIETIENVKSSLVKRISDSSGWTPPMEAHQCGHRDGNAHQIAAFQNFMRTAKSILPSKRIK